MTDTLFDATLELALELGGAYSGTTTGGATDTLVDAHIPGSDDDWNGGAYFIETGDNAGVFGFIEDFEESTGTITFEETLTDAIVSDVDYVLTKAMWPLPMLKNAINRQLRKLRIPQVDETLTTVANQTEYTLPATVHDLRKVRLLEDEADANAPKPKRLSWGLKVTDTGVQNLLVLDRQPPSGKTLRLIYVATHPRLRDATDEMNEKIEIQRIIPGAAMHCHKERHYLYRSGSEMDVEMYRHYKSEDQEVRGTHYFTLPQMEGRFLHNPNIGS